MPLIANELSPHPLYFCKSSCRHFVTSHPPSLFPRRPYGNTLFVASLHTVLMCHLELASLSPPHDVVVVVVVVVSPPNAFGVNWNGYAIPSYLTINS